MPELNRDEFKLYHGTAGKIDEGVVRPSTDGALGTGAYAATEPEVAAHYARLAARSEDQQRLFGTVYEVEPMSDVRDLKSLDFTYADKEGLRTKKAVGFPPTDNDVYHGTEFGKGLNTISTVRKKKGGE